VLVEPRRDGLATDDRREPGPVKPGRSGHAARKRPACALRGDLCVEIAVGFGEFFPRFFSSFLSPFPAYRAPKGMRVNPGAKETGSGAPAPTSMKTRHVPSGCFLQIDR
jgi:hypothetical protein